jgi:hypothetical protein
MSSKKKAKGNDGDAINKNDADIENLVCMVFENVNKRQREKNIRDIACMVVENNRERNIAKLANMVVKYRRSYVGRDINKDKINDWDIREIVELVKANKDVRISPSVFSITQIRTNQRFNYNEYIYNVKIGSENMHSLPDFLVNFTKNISIFN